MDTIEPQKKTPKYVLDAIKRYYHRNKNNVEFQQKVKERSQKYYELNKEKIKERQKQYYYDNKEKILLNMKARRDKLKATGDSPAEAETETDTE